MLVYVIASRPYPEKISDSKFYLINTHAERVLNSLPKELKPYFKIYRAEINIVDEYVPDSEEQ